MEKVSVSVTPEHLEQIEARAEQDGTGRSAALRAILDEYDDLQTECDDLQTECDSLRAERDDLRRQLAEANTRIDSANEIVEHVREQRSLEQRRAEAGLATRAKWWVFGMDQDEVEA